MIETTKRGKKKTEKRYKKGNERQKDQSWIRKPIQERKKKERERKNLSGPLLHTIPKKVNETDQALSFFKMGSQALERTAS